MSRLKPKFIRLTVLILIVFFSLTFSAQCKEQDEATNSFIDGIAYVILKKAWPTAKYRYWKYEKTSFKDNGNKEIIFKIHARSSWSDGPLWLEVKMEIDDNFNIVDFGWGDYKAFIPPGFTSDLVAEIIEESQQNNAASAKYDKICFENHCDKNIYIALQYKQLNGNWITDGWWELSPHEAASLTKTKHQTFYYHAETKGTAVQLNHTDIYSKVKNSKSKFGFEQAKITSKSWGEWTTHLYCN